VKVCHPRRNVRNVHRICSGTDEKRIHPGNFADIYRKDEIHVMSHPFSYIAAAYQRIQLL
jgi:hypothetical protein